LSGSVVVGSDLQTATTPTVKSRQVAERLMVSM